MLWIKYPGQNSQTNYAQKVQINYNLNDPEVETAARQYDADVSDDRGECQDQDFDQADGCPLI